MPHASTWFPDHPAADPPHGAAHNTAGHQPTAHDDDLAVASERISIKCPITLLPMKDPVTSTKCPHSFEKEAILSMINASDVMVDGSAGRRGGGRKAMQCPVCTVVSKHIHYSRLLLPLSHILVCNHQTRPNPPSPQMLTPTDLAPNPVLVRKIQRIQAAENARIQDASDPDPDSDDDDVRAPANGRRAAEEIGSSPARTRTRTPRVKQERRSQALRRESREVSMVPNSQVQVQGLRGVGGGGGGSAGMDVVDLGGEEEEEDDDDDVEE